MRVASSVQEGGAAWGKAAYCSNCKDAWLCACQCDTLKTEKPREGDRKEKGYGKKYEKETSTTEQGGIHIKVMVPRVQKRATSRHGATAECIATHAIFRAALPTSKRKTRTGSARRAHWSGAIYKKKKTDFL